MSTVSGVEVGGNGSKGGLTPKVPKRNSDLRPFLRASPAGALIYANDSAWALLRTMGWSGRILPEPFLTALQSVLSRAEEFRFEISCGDDTYSFRVAPGYRRYFFIFTGTRVDPTAALRQALSESEAFAHTVAHDLRGSVRAICALTQATLADCEPVLGTNAEALKRVTAAAVRMNRFLEDLLELSKSSLRPLEFRTLDAAELLRGLIEERPEWQRPQAVVEIASATMPVRGDVVCLTQCLSNLLSNAIKFVLPGTQPRVRIYSEQNGRQTRIVFEDNGIGIPREDLPNLFKPLHRSRTSARFEGTGLGLAIVQRAVSRMGGNVGLESKPGKGSRFWVELPAADGDGPNGNGEQG